jgi:membrane-associated phospholipid phosphatase
VSPGELDRSALLLARTRLHAPAADRAVSLFSRTSEHAACWLVLGAIGAATAPHAARRRAWLRGTLIVASSYAANYAVKLVVRRARPQLPGLEPLTPTVSRLSFPSAHATTSFAAARAFSDVAPAGLLYGAAVAFALSRPYLGVHYPSDVVVGALLGSAIAEAWPS